MDFKSVPNLQWIFKQQRWVFKNSYGFLKTAMGFQKQTSLRSHLAVKLRGRLSRPPRPVAEMSFGCAQCHLRGPNRQTCTLAWVVRAGGRYKTSGTNHYCAACVLLACKITKAQEYLPGFCTRCKSRVELSLPNSTSCRRHRGPDRAQGRLRLRRTWHMYRSPVDCLDHKHQQQSSSNHNQALMISPCIYI